MSANVSERLLVESRGKDLITVRFDALGHSCEILLPAMSRHAALAIGTVAAMEAWRIERKYERQWADSVTANIHVHRGSRINVDDETASLIEFSMRCFEISGGKFDITSGALRRARNVGGSRQFTDTSAAGVPLPSVGLDNLQWEPPNLLLPRGMELDLGAVARDYAVDQVSELLERRNWAPCLVKIGCRWRAHRVPSQGPWQIETDECGTHPIGGRRLTLERGALAMSGDRDRRTPEQVGRRFVTVAAGTCQQAGFLSTVAVLHGAGARQFLRGTGHRHWLG